MKKRWHPFSLCVFVGCFAGLSAQTNTIHDTGNVGIGTLTPVAKLEVVDSGGSYQIGTNSVYFSGFKTTAPTGMFGFQQNERAFFGLSGNVYGRGFSSNAIAIFNGSIIAEDIVLCNQNDGNAGILVLKASGNVGMGTATPNYPLQISTTLSSPTTLQTMLALTGNFGSATRTGFGVGLNFGGTMPGNISLENAAAIYGYNQDVSDNGFALGFATRPNASTYPMERMTIQRGGNVGIGTTSPATNLEVKGINPAIRLNDQDTSRWQMQAVGARSGEFEIVSTANWKIPLAIDASQNVYLGSSATALPLNAPLYVQNGGNIGIGTTNPTHKLSVNGTVRAKEVIVDTGWSDYVFAPDYHLPALSDVEAHIKAEKHLPGIPSAQEVAAEGISVGEMQAKLLAKIEELTLHVIEQEKAISSVRVENAALRSEVESLKTTQQIRDETTDPIQLK